MKLANGYYECVYGHEYAESTLKGMKKSTLIELLHFAQHNYKRLLAGYDNAQKNAEQLQEQISNWIPVEEDITDKEVLCCNKRGFIMIGFLEKDNESETGYVARSDFEIMQDVVAWQPKPKSYKES